MRTDLVSYTNGPPLTPLVVLVGGVSPVLYSFLDR